jgi:hypothetical protein
MRKIPAEIRVLVNGFYLKRGCKKERAVPVAVTVHGEIASYDEDEAPVAFIISVAKLIRKCSEEPVAIRLIDGRLWRETKVDETPLPRETSGVGGEQPCRKNGWTSIPPDFVTRRKDLRNLVVELDGKRTGLPQRLFVEGERFPFVLDGENDAWLAETDGTRRRRIESDRAILAGRDILSKHVLVNGIPHALETCIPAWAILNGTNGILSACLLRANSGPKYGHVGEAFDHAGKYVGIVSKSFRADERELGERFIRAQKKSVMTIGEIDVRKPELLPTSENEGVARKRAEQGIASLEAVLDSPEFAVLDEQAKLRAVREFVGRIRRRVLDRPEFSAHERITIAEAFQNDDA